MPRACTIAGVLFTVTVGVEAVGYVPPLGVSTPSIWRFKTWIFASRPLIKEALVGHVRSVLRRSLSAVNNPNLDRRSCGVQLESKLFLDCGEN